MTAPHRIVAINECSDAHRLPQMRKSFEPARTPTDTVSANATPIASDGQHSLVDGVRFSVFFPLSFLSKVEQIATEIPTAKMLVTCIAIFCEQRPY